MLDFCVVAERQKSLFGRGAAMDTSHKSELSSVSEAGMRVIARATAG